jgi:hypothetical protein
MATASTKTKLLASTAATGAEGEDDDTLADDILRGAERIGAFIGLETRKTFYGLQNGRIPGFKEGDVWISTKSRLTEHYQKSQYEPATENH